MRNGEEEEEEEGRRRERKMWKKRRKERKEKERKGRKERGLTWFRYPDSGAYVPQFPKRKEEGWWLILGDPHTGELIALRRVNGKGKSDTQLV
jgi:hypothetical protein